MVTQRSYVMQQLASLSTAEILSLLTDDTILEVAARYFEINANTMDANEPLSPSGTDIVTTPPAQDVAGNDSAPRAKRPLNAFMAFRTFYMKLFPDIQQKTASGFLTTLWNKDPFRNKWALIAKVYSFVRDEVGKGNISLSRFLDVCCPTMNIIEPRAYIAALGWTVKHDDTGSQVLLEGTPTDLSRFQDESVPNTEMELLRGLLNTGYLSDRGLALMERLGESSNGIMTTYGASMEAPVILTTEKLDFVDLVRENPQEAVRALVDDTAREFVFQQEIPVYDVYDLSNAPFHSIRGPQPNPSQHYTFSNSSLGLYPVRALTLSSVGEFDAIDLDSPFDIDVIMGHTRSEGERTRDQPEGEPFDPHADYNSLL